MVTRLGGPAPVFLPFYLGNEGVAGNPVKAPGGYRTAYPPLLFQPCSDCPVRQLFS